MYQLAATAAARLRGGVFGLGALRGDQKKKKEMIRHAAGFVSRRYSSMKEDGNKSLHLCFFEHIKSQEHRKCDVVRSIKLSDLLSPPTITTKEKEKEKEKEKNEIEHETYHDSEARDGNRFSWGCSRFGSHIVFAGGPPDLDSVYNKAGTREEIVIFDPHSSPKPQFKSPKSTRLLGHYQLPIGVFEVDGRLYCLDTRSQQYYSSAPSFSMSIYPHFAEAPPAFAVLHPEGDGDQFQAKWLRLESPPRAILYEDNSHKREELMHCVVDETKILVWNQDKVGVYCFDASRPEKGWIELHYPLATTLPFVKGCWGDTAPHHGGEGTLIFTYDCTSGCEDSDGSTYYDGPQISNNISVQALLMSHNLDSLQAMKPFQLPEIPCEFRKDEFRRGDGTTEYCLVHLGDDKVCLILHKYFYETLELADRTGRNKGILHLMTFQYQVTPDLNMQYRLLTTRSYEYYTKLPNNDFETVTTEACLTKAFVI